jgi:TolB-like protein
MNGVSGRLLVVILLVLCPMLASSLPQVAVLEAVLAAGIDPTVSGPVTDRVVEEMVSSGKFTVIDRENVEYVLREKEFQLSSGVVKDEEVRRAGEYLGADLVVVANLSRVGSTYTMSARMIDVVSGKITAQVSADMKGSIDVALELARLVGRQLAGEKLPAALAAQEEKPTPEMPVADPLAATKLQALIKSRAHLRPVGQQEMKALSALLDERDRLYLYSSNDKDNALLGLLLNLLVPGVGIGSWVQADFTGGLWQLGLTAVGGACTAAGLARPVLYFVGAGILAYDVVYLVVRPFSWVKIWNRSLAAALDVPYVALLEPEGNVLLVERSPAGTQWRLALNLVRIRY